MAEFQTTRAVTAGIDKIIREAEEKLVLISPYLRIDNTTRELLDDLNDKGIVTIHVIYGKNQLRTDENKWLNSLNSIKISFREDLHAKCYLNEKEALVTSMNLYAFSMQNNVEMGILVCKDEKEDEGLYKDILRHVEWIERRSKTEKEPGNARKSTRKKARKPQSASGKGFCIRCGIDIPVNPQKPYCFRHFKSWDRYKDDNYQEECCHTCSKEHQATMKKPVCISCYRKYKDVLEFAS